jgi:hypothetical protein
MDHASRVAFLNGYTQAINDLSRGAKQEDMSKHASGPLMTWAFNKSNDIPPPEWKHTDGQLWTDDEVQNMSPEMRQLLGR